MSSLSFEVRALVTGPAPWEWQAGSLALALLMAGTSLLREIPACPWRLGGVPEWCSGSRPAPLRACLPAGWVSARGTEATPVPSSPGAQGPAHARELWSPSVNTWPADQLLIFHIVDLKSENWENNETMKLRLHSWKQQIEAGGVVGGREERKRAGGRGRARVDGAGVGHSGPGRALGCSLLFCSASTGAALVLCRPDS